MADWKVGNRENMEVTVKKRIEKRQRVQKGWEGNVNGVHNEVAEKRVLGIEDDKVAAHEVGMVGDSKSCVAARADQCGRFVTAALASIKPPWHKIAHVINAALHSSMHSANSPTRPYLSHPAFTPNIDHHPPPQSQDTVLSRNPFFHANYQPSL